MVLPDRDDVPEAAEKPEEKAGTSKIIEGDNTPREPPVSSQFVLEIVDDGEDDEPLEEVQIPEARTPADAPIRSMAELAAAHAQVQGVNHQSIEETLLEPAVQASTPKLSAGRSRSGTSTPAKTNGAAAHVKPINGKTPRRQPARRGRKRARSDDEDSAVSELDEPVRTTPSKRSRAAPPPAKTDRVLRSRRGKTEEQKLAEREEEEALREALGE